MAGKEIQAATSGPNASWAALFNPVSAWSSSVDKYPEWVASAAESLGISKRTAWLASKSAATALLATAVAGGARALQHLVRVADIRSESDDPAKSMRSNISTSFNMPLQKKKDALNKKAEYKNPVEKSKALSMDSVTEVALPLATLILGAIGAYGVVDKYADRRRNEELTQAIERKSNIVRDLIQTRAQLSKGTIDPDAAKKSISGLRPSSYYVKTASLHKQADGVTRKAVAGFGVLLLAIAAATGVGSYKYFSASNPNNIEYKAMKKGLEQYARNKSMITPVTIMPTDAKDYFKAIDGNQGDTTDVRSLPEMQPANTPISVTL